MKTKTIKKIALWGIGSFAFLALVLAVHIYWVYRPKAPDAYTRVMARIDIKQPINQDQAGQINTWMYHQKGIDHVLVNPQNRIVIFTFFPIKTSGNEVVKNFRSAFHLKAERFIPTEADLASSCPVAGASFAYKVYKFIDHVL